MAHELDTTSTGALAYVGRQDAWHQGGTVIGEDAQLNVTQALAIIEGDHQVNTAPVYVRRVTDVRSGEMVFAPEVIDAWEAEGRETLEEFHQCPDNNATVRMDRGSVLGVVGSRYTPLQNRDAFGVLTPLLDAGLAKITTAGVLREGRDVWMQVEFILTNPAVQAAFNGRNEKERIIPYAVISNNHSGRRQVQMQETPVRVVCANTLAMARSSFAQQVKRGRGFEVRHTLNVELRTTEAAQLLFADVTANMATIAMQFELLKQLHLDTATFRKLVLDTAAPIPTKLQRRDLSGRESTSLRTIEKVRDRLEFLWENGDGHTGDHSAWEAYQAVTQSVDHDAKLWRVKGDDDARLVALFEGRLGTVKQDVVDVLVSAAASAPETEAWRESLGAEFSL